MREITATNFKARCLALLDDVADSGAELIVTKRGSPVARVVPFDAGASMLGTVTLLVSDDGLIEPIDDEWDVERPTA